MSESTPVTFVGIDAHLKTLSIAVLPEHGPAVDRPRTIANEPAAVRRAFRKLLDRGSVHAVYEAGCLGFSCVAASRISGYGATWPLRATSPPARATDARPTGSTRSAWLTSSEAATWCSCRRRRPSPKRFARSPEHAAPRSRTASGSSSVSTASCWHAVSPGGQDQVDPRPSPVAAEPRARPGGRSLHPRLPPARAEAARGFRRRARPAHRRAGGTRRLPPQATATCAACSSRPRRSTPSGSKKA